MSETLAADLCVIGAGAGGLTLAAGAAQLGAATILVERARMGGDCLNFGCVPSKALLAAARRAELARAAAQFGIAATPRVDFPAVMRHVRAVIASLAPQDSEARFAGMGVRVIRAAAAFTGPDTLAAGPYTIRARRFAIATGSRPALPPIPGLAAAPYLTNETVFDLDALPAHLVVIGAGAAGLELAQAFRLLGAQVTVVEAATPLGREDPELAGLLVERLGAAGVAIRAETRIARVEGTALVLENGERIAGSHLLVAAGRTPNLAGLALETAGIATDATGALVLDRRLRTANRRVFALGDAAGGPQFTHVAAYHAGIVIRNALFRLPARVDYRALPRVVYTEPELAQIGMTEAEARRAHGGQVTVLRWPFFENDRAQAERATHGLVKLVAGRRGRVLGAAILGAAAGELIQSWGLAVAHGLKLKAMADLMLPYPTLGDAAKRAAGSFYAPLLFSPRTRRLVRFLARFG